MLFHLGKDALTGQWSSDEVKREKANLAPPRPPQQTPKHTYS